VAVFLAFASAYFLSALLRAVTATLAPIFSTELALGAGALGLLAGAYFLGFALVQLPLGLWLDRFGPRRTLLALLAVAVLGCGAFALAGDLIGLIAARALIGVGMGACLMAPLTAYRRLFSPAAQLGANSWMLMTGSLGMVASTLPVQWLLPSLGWRGLFWLLAGLLAGTALWVSRAVPADPIKVRPAAGSDSDGGYRRVLRHPLFVRCVPMGFFIYGGLIALQSLWVGPWLTRLTGATPNQAAQGLFAVNLVMLFTFLAWGLAMPRLARRGLDAQRIMRWGLPLSLLLLAFNVAQGTQAGAAHWALWCVACSVITLSQPAIGAVFPAGLAGRALSAFNLVIFAGVFCIQWGIGLAVDAARTAGLGEVAAFQAAFAAFGAACLLSYLWFLWPLGFAALPATAAADNAKA
jgi:predicted MFS family arabinose efflux permease